MRFQRVLGGPRGAPACLLQVVSVGFRGVPSVLSISMGLQEISGTFRVFFSGIFRSVPWVFQVVSWAIHGIQGISKWFHDCSRGIKGVS